MGECEEEVLLGYQAVESKTGGPGSFGLWPYVCVAKVHII